MKRENLKEKVAILFGACGGIGTEIVKMLENEGVQLILADVNKEGLEKFRNFVNDSILYECDITNKEQIIELYQNVLDKFEKIDILINTVGIIIPNLFEDTTYAEIERQININLIGAINCIKEVIPIMKEQEEGYIITLSSLAGIVPETYSSIYTATKFALRGLNLTLNLELKEHNINVSTIFPDSVDTPMLEYEAKCESGSPLTFLDDPVPPKDVADAVMKAILKKKAEVCVPRSQGILSKFVMCFPKAVQRLWPRFEEKGRENKQKFLEKLEKQDN
jgi:short-subunit dehydrogenase